MKDVKSSSHRYVDSLTFDREIPLVELIDATDRIQLTQVLSGILGVPWELVDLENNRILGDSCKVDATQVPIVLDLEPIGYLRGELEDTGAFSVARQCLLLQIRFAQKYLMASALHIEAIQEDYETLRKEHEALLASEARFKNLCEHLDEKVKAQVQTIESAQRQLFESEKLASVGQLAAGIAHEINNPIGFVNSNLNTAKGYVKELQGLNEQVESVSDLKQLKAFWQESDFGFVLDDFADLLGDCIDGGRRVAEIVSDLKLFSNIDAEEELVTDIGRYISTSCNVARTSAGEGITVSLEMSELPMIKCRPAYIGQVILALVMNASDAMKKQGAVQLRSYVDDRGVVVEVKDQGPGIPAAVIDKVFDPFFTTKVVGEGKGLGLTSCRDIVLAHGGDIAIDSEEGIGTTVTFWLPIQHK